MLIMRQEQMHALREVAASNFEAALVERGRQFAPRLAALRGAQAMQRLVVAAVRHARVHGFDRRGPVRFWVEMSLAHGLRWFDDPQLEPVNRHLAEREPDQLARAERVHAALLAHVARADGEARVLARQALAELLALDWKTLLAPQPDPAATAIAVMQVVHPHRARLLGQATLNRVAIAAGAACRELGIEVQRGQVLLAVLMIGFGHGVLEDPMYPWVRSTLADGTAPAARRCEALARKTRRYARAVLDHWTS
ncbi:MAG: hypothetical protein KIS83_15095 [Rubrivivax sp.]|nr:hypothetical protein [Rubrivivax sp.]